MKKTNYFLKSFISAGGVFAYVSFVSWFLSNAKNIFGPAENTLVIPIFMMLLFVISATVTGLLVLGKPVSLFMSGLKKEAFILLFATIGWLLAFLLAVGLILYYLS